jgi:hypothetical protein
MSTNNIFYCTTDWEMGSTTKVVDLKQIHLDHRETCKLHINVTKTFKLTKRQCDDPNSTIKFVNHMLKT